MTDRNLRKGLIVIALTGLVLGTMAWFAGRDVLAGWIWAAGTVPVVVGLAVSMVLDFMAGRMGVDTVAFVSMSAALLLGQNLAGAVVAVMYAGGNMLEDFAVARAERDLKSLVDRAPRVAHRRTAELVEDGAFGHPPMPPATARALHQDHKNLEASLDRLREIADALDDAAPAAAVVLIGEANRLVAGQIVEHERDDESRIYPRLAKVLHEGHGLAAMSRAHREILHLARLLARLSDELRTEDADRYLIRDAQRVIESIEALVRLHNAQEEDIYEHAASE